MDRKNIEAIRSRKAQLIADLAVSRAGLRRDVEEVRKLGSIPGQIRSAFKGGSTGKMAAAAGAVSVAAGAAVSRFFKKGKKAASSSSESPKAAASSVLNEAVTLVVDLLLRKGIDRYLEKDWQRTAARGVMALLSRR